jgi:methionyl-tRNA synthetase
MDLVTIDEFRKLDLRVGKIISVENHPQADKLYIIKIDIGNEVKQSVAGLKPYLTPEQLINKTVAVVANLQPAMLRGMESQVMILAASAGNEVIPLTTEKPAPAGSKIS